MSLSQQKRLYEAERCLWSYGRQFSNIEEAVGYLDTFTACGWFIDQFGYLPAIHIYDAKLGKWAGAADRDNCIIYLKRRTENVVLHELAHILNSTDEHDRSFVEIYKTLIRNTMGIYAWAEFNYELAKAEYYAS